METQEKSVRFIKGIGPKRFEALKRLGVETIRDLCYFFPRQYQDRTHFQKINELLPDTHVTIKGEVLACALKPLRSVNLFEIKIGDETGIVTAIWFNRAYLKSQFQIGDQILLSGKVETYQDRLQFNSPEYEKIQKEDEDTVHTGRITPIYPLSEGLVQRSLRASLKEVIDHYSPNEMIEFLPEDIKNKLGLADLNEAIRNMHFPESFEKLKEARERIVFDEFFIFEMILFAKIKSIELKEQALKLRQERKLLEEFLNALPFKLTMDQASSIEEIWKNVGSGIPMNRLLQGEVGSGKTIIAAFFLYLAQKSGTQGALLVPTEILAEQHFLRLSDLLKKFEINCALLTGSTDPIDRKITLANITNGRISVVIGTHALLQEDVLFKNLSLVVIDEQHRFGVRQRSKLILRNPRPHLLVMTATPIPRTLGLTLYGDLEISTLKMLPAGRKEIKTYWISEQKEAEVLESIKKEIVEHGEQAYILFPIIEESENLDLQAAKQEYERLKTGLFKDIPIGLVHGRLSKKERDDAMRKFHKDEIKVLIATSVIEVGVDNPNVSYMVIEHAERFGLSQLHQMRGRIGRGSKQSHCFLFGTPSTDDGKKRLKILTKTNDGFKIAEEDLILRGPGEFFGTKQSGVPFFKTADLIKDGSALSLARKEAKALIDEDPDLSKLEHQVLREEMNTRKHLLQVQ